MFTDQTISFIGSGMMGEAIIRGLLAQDGMIKAQQIIATDVREDRLAELEARYGIGVSTSNAEAADEAQVVVLSIKPQTIPKVMPQIRGQLRRSDLLLSIIAGTTIKTLSDGAAHGAIVRCMPNTPAQIGQGITVWTSTQEVNESQKEQAQAIVRSLGKEIYVHDEHYLDMTTAVSGSGPAYVFLMMEAMIDAAVHLGFSRPVATQLVYQTMRGSVEYAEQSGQHVAELRNQVTSPGGTTAEALYHMEKEGLRTAIARGIWGAYERAVALGGADKRKKLDA
ncbi:MAG: pyrroline-5-carboxylate reductase [Ardenticatenaceae bacterium]